MRQDAADAAEELTNTKKDFHDFVKEDILTKLEATFDEHDSWDEICSTIFPGLEIDRARPKRAWHKIAALAHPDKQVGKSIVESARHHAAFIFMQKRFEGVL